ncbi:hypothetical protein DZ860_02110 [Vibrio sinensis]|uniref:Uncharacterized protein n=1 Tax=Vibrio sinensis TaxID=2302434 RepID=A0A3A6R2D9_9VIBR|nr:hypothetical protein DZ860_02110 [Vibrio sinensis]
MIKETLKRNYPKSKKPACLPAYLSAVFKMLHSKSKKNWVNEDYFELAISFLTIMAAATMKAMIRPSSINSPCCLRV